LPERKLEEDAVDPEKKYPFLASLLCNFDKRHRKTIGLMIAAIAVTGQARSMAIGSTVARWLGTRLDSAINRFYRLMRNQRVDYEKFLVQWARHVVRRADRHLLVAVDWTEWHHDLRLLAAAVVVEKRAVPLFVQGFGKVVRLRSQNTRENNFLRALADGIRRADVTATLLFDRGFRRASLVELLQELRLGFVIRLMDDVHVEVSPGLKMALKDIVLCPGQIQDLGVVPLRSDGVANVRIIGYWAPGAAEPWWLATSETGRASRVLKLYDRRMTVEEQFRDVKGQRFGAKLFWTQFKNPEALARFVTLLAVALLIWMLTGLAAATYDRSLRLVSRKKGPRQSYVTIGVRIAALDQEDGSFTAAWAASVLAAPAVRAVGKLHVGGK
jgi:hypothetical protein